MRALEVDTIAAEVVRAFDEAGIESILLKGASLAAWLYGGRPRGYDDVDLLVAPGSARVAARVLGAKGFIDESPHMAPCERGVHAVNWSRGHECIDLHHTVIGATASPDAVWRVLSPRSRRIRVGGHQSRVLDPPALAFMCALHAAQHGRHVTKPLCDLALALEHGDAELWRQAAEIAEELGALHAFDTGLRLLPEGALLARTLRVPHNTSLAVAIRAESPARLVRGLEQLRMAPSTAERWRILVRRLFPTASHLRATSARARTNRLGLVLAYIWRPIWVVGGALPALVRWVRLRHRVVRSWAEGGRV